MHLPTFYSPREDQSLEIPSESDHRIQVGFPNRYEAGENFEYRNSSACD